MKIDEVRKEFEAWALQHEGYVQEALNALWDGDMYRNVEFQKRFKVWQVRQHEVDALKAKVALMTATLESLLYGDNANETTQPRI